MTKYWICSVCQLLVAENRVCVCDARTTSFLGLRWRHAPLLRVAETAWAQKYTQVSVWVDAVRCNNHTQNIPHWTGQLLQLLTGLLLYSPWILHNGVWSPKCMQLWPLCGHSGQLHFATSIQKTAYQVSESWSLHVVGNIHNNLPKGPVAFPGVPNTKHVGVCQNTDWGTILWQHFLCCKFIMLLLNSVRWSIASM